MLASLVLKNCCLFWHSSVLVLVHKRCLCYVSGSCYDANSLCVESFNIGCLWDIPPSQLLRSSFQIPPRLYQEYLQYLPLTPISRSTGISKEQPCIKNILFPLFVKKLIKTINYNNFFMFLCTPVFLHVTKMRVL